MKLKTVYENDKYQETQKKIAELKAREQGLIQRVESIRQGLSDSDVALTTQARRVLDGEQVSFQANPDIEPLYAELRIVKKAIQLAESDLRNIHQKAAKEIVSQAEPEAKQIAKGTLKALQTLSDAIGKEILFYDELSRAGVGPDTRPAHWNLRPLIRESLLRGYELSSGNNPLRQCLNEYKLFWK